MMTPNDLNPSSSFQIGFNPYAYPLPAYHNTNSYEAGYYPYDEDEAIARGYMCARPWNVPDDDEADALTQAQAAPRCVTPSRIMAPPPSPPPSSPATQPSLSPSTPTSSTLEPGHPANVPDSRATSPVKVPAAPASPRWQEDELAKSPEDPPTARVDKGKARAEAPLSWEASGSHETESAQRHSEGRKYREGSMKENIPPEQAQVHTPAAPTVPAPQGVSRRGGRKRKASESDQLNVKVGLQEEPSSAAGHKRKRRRVISLAVRGRVLEATLPARPPTPVPGQAGPSSLALPDGEQSHHDLPSAELDDEIDLCELDNGDCDYVQTYDYNVDNDHLNTHGAKDKKTRLFACTFRDCERGFTQKCDRNRHVMQDHWNWWFKCEEPRCRKGYGRRDMLHRHTASAHQK